MSSRRLLIQRPRRALRRARAVLDERFPRKLGPATRLISRAVDKSADTDTRLLLLAALAALHEESSRRTGAVEPLRFAVTLMGSAVELALPDHPNLGALLINLAMTQFSLFGMTGDLDLPDSMASHAQRACGTVAVDSPRRADVLSKAAAVLVEAAEALDRPALLDDAVAAASASVATGEGDLDTLAVALRLRFEYTGDPADLAGAERFGRQSIELADAQQTTTADQLAELGHVLRLRHEVTGELADAYAAVAACRRSVELTNDQSELPARLVLLSSALLDSYQSGDEDALVEALGLARSALASDGPPDLVRCQTAATVFKVWADRHNDPTALIEAEQAARDAVRAAGSTASDRAIALDTLATVLHARFVLDGDTELLDRSIETSERATAEASPNPSDRAGQIGNLGVALFDRYAVTGDRADLDAAISLDRQAVALLADPHPELGRYLNNLGVSLLNRYQVSGADQDLMAAIESARIAVARTPTGPDRAFRLSNLGAALFARHDRFGDLADIDEDVGFQREAIELLPTGHPDLPGLQHNLAIALRARHTYLGVQDDLAEAVAALRDAVAAPPRIGHLPDLLSSYGVALDALANVTGNPAYREAAVSQLRRSVAMSRNDDPELPRRLGNLVTVLESSASVVDGAAADAVDAARRAVSAMPADHPDLPALRSNLALALRARHADGDADEAVATATAAVTMVPEDHPDRADFLGNLALVLHDRLERPAPSDEVERVLAALRTAARVRTAPPATRLRAATAWGHLAAEHGDRTDAAHGLGLAVELLPEVSPQRLERLDAQRWLSDFAGLASDAAALHLADDQPERALSLLELGRGVLLNRQLRIRDDLSPLRAADSTLAADFERLRDELDRLDAAESAPLPMADTTAVGDAHIRAAAGRRRERRQEVVREFTAVVERIQNTPGFTGFLGPVSADVLRTAAADGPVVVVNVSQYGCDALLLTAAGLRHVPLQDLRADQLDQMALDFHRQVLRAGDSSTSRADAADAEDQLAHILDRLWRTIADPIVSTMDRMGALTGPDPVLWWVPTGSLAFLPLHAAMARESGESVLDRVASSYTPTVTALHVARRKPMSEAEDRPVVILSTAGAGTADFLPSAVEEARWVAKRWHVDPLDAADAAAAIPAAIARCSRLHVALHARSDPDDPARGCLLLGGSNLTVTDIAAMRNDRARFAFLSACETTLTTAALADEAIHLTSAFLLAGFPSVVGTLWQVRDAVSIHAAEQCYERMSRRGYSALLALHDTVLFLRNRYRRYPSVWAAYHHAGA